MEPLTALIPLFFLTALVYSMAGFAGGSTYLALLVLFGFPHPAIPKIGLICNLIVAAGGLYHFAGYVRGRMILPILLGSIPAAYLGGRMPVEEGLFHLLLGLSLVVAASRLLLSSRSSEQRRPASWKRRVAVGFPLGVGLGWLSGVVGIGGGIFLAPILLLLRWADAREAAAAATLFILLNSAAGLAGQFAKGVWPEASMIAALAAAVFLGGQIGSRLGANRLPVVALQRLTGLFVLGVAGRLLFF